MKTYIEKTDVGIFKYWVDYLDTGVVYIAAIKRITDNKKDIIGSNN